MPIDQMRNTLSTVYQGEKWKHKVATMSDGQVIAIYYKFLATRKIK